MTLRCKDGDIAIIVHDTPECADNLGRVVEVKGPPRWGIGYELVCWRIRPISATLTLPSNDESHNRCD